MRYSSQIFLRTDGSLGRWPVIETDDNNTITAISEYDNGIPEMGHHYFESGLIVCLPRVLPEFSPSSARVLAMHSSSKEEFIFELKKVFKLYEPEDQLSLIGKKAVIYHVSGFDLNTFCAESVIIRRLA